MDGNQPPDLHAIFKQLNTLVQGEVKLNKFTAKRNFEKSLLPKQRERLQQYILRVDSDLQALITTHGVIIDEEDLANRILYDGLSCYPHIQDLLVPWRSGKEEIPTEYSKLKLMVLNHDMIRDPDSWFLPATQSVAENARNYEPRTASTQCFFISNNSVQAVWCLDLHLSVSLFSGNSGPFYTLMVWQTHACEARAFAGFNEHPLFH